MLEVDWSTSDGCGNSFEEFDKLYRKEYEGVVSRLFKQFPPTIVVGVKNKNKTKTKNKKQLC